MFWRPRSSTKRISLKHTLLRPGQVRADSAINDAKIKIKGFRSHSLRTLSYFFKLYGLYAVIFASLAVVLFSILITRFSEASALGVPLWSSFFAGLGSSAQILTGIADDLRRYGMASRY
jgi:hypothetical protein